MRAAVLCVGLLLAPACGEQPEPAQSYPMTAAGMGGFSAASGAGANGGAGAMMAPVVDAGSAAAGGSTAAMDAGSTPDAARPEDAGPRDDDPASDAAVDASADDDRCGVAVFDPSRPPVALDVTGDLGTHDPALIEENGTFYLWQTGPRLPGKSSRDLLRWSGAPSALGASNPGWIGAEVPGATDLWAPDVSYFGGTFHLYYSASTFGSNHSCIGHATRESLTAGSWVDHGSIVCSGTDDDYNTIDPNAVVDTDGTPWLAFGSFWSGIKIVRLNDDGTRADDVVHAIASRGGGAIEAPFIVRRCGFYYLFVSFDRCCNGTSSTYNIRVGRSPDILGPYVDAAGTAMMDGGGTPLLSGEDRYRGPGHNAVIFSESAAYNVFHAYDANDGGRSKLRVAELVWDDEGWPISGGP